MWVELKWLAKKPQTLQLRNDLKLLSASFQSSFVMAYGKATSLTVRLLRRVITCLTHMNKPVRIGRVSFRIQCTGCANTYLSKCAVWRHSNSKWNFVWSSTLTKVANSVARRASAIRVTESEVTCSLYYLWIQPSVYLLFSTQSISVTRQCFCYWGNGVTTSDFTCSFHCL